MNLLLVTILPSFLIIIFFVKSEKFPEPTSSIIKIFCYGIFITIPAFIINTFLGDFFSKLNISQNLIARASDLEKLNFKNNKHSRLFKSWRNEVFGEKIKKFFNNKLKIVSKENNFFLEKN